MAIARQRRGRAGGGRKHTAPHRAFGARLAQLRKSASLTQLALAVRLQVSRRQIAYYESGLGRPPGALLGRIADLFHTSTDALLGRRRASHAPLSLGSAIDARLRRLARLGSAGTRRLVVHLDRFLASERARR